MFYTDDPIRDFERYDSRREKTLENRPVCCECGERVQAEYYFDINDEVICPACLFDNHRKDVEDYAG